ncbi:MAG: hypothetical protein IJ966_07105 [Bacilli bacterium]|nr:hypothetical protein [Bacilli bacterium]
MNKKKVGTVLLLIGVGIVSIGIGWLLGDRFHKPEEKEKPKEDNREVIKYNEIDFVESIKTENYTKNIIEADENKIKITINKETIYSNELSSKVVNIKLLCDCESCYNLYVMTEDGSLYTAIGEFDKDPNIAKKLEKILIDPVKNIGPSVLNTENCKKQELYVLLNNNSVAKYKETGLEPVKVIN